MTKKWKKFVVVATIALPLALGTATAYGFEDTKGDPAEAEINTLLQASVINGINSERFEPKSIMTLAQGVQLIVRALDLNIDTLRFINQPVASDYFEHVAADTWYANAMIIAYHSGLSLTKDLNPNKQLTEGEFVKLLKQGLSPKTEADVSGLFKDYTDSRTALTRSKAAKLTAQARVFLKAPWQDQQQHPVTVSTAKASDGVDAVTLTWANRPSAGYRVSIEGIEFHDGDPGSSGIAVIRYSLHQPKPGSMNAQVITDAKATTYVASDRKIELLQVK